MDEPVVYFKPGCPFGIRLRTALTLHRVPHRSVRFRDDEEGAARVRDVNAGNEISPTVHIAGSWLINPAWREVRDMTLVAARHRTGPGQPPDRGQPDGDRATQGGRAGRTVSGGATARPASIASSPPSP